MFALAVPFAVIAFFRRKADAILFWILLASVTILGNINFMPKNAIYAYSNRVMLSFIGLCGGLMLFTRKKSKMVTPLLGMYIYLAYAFIPSLSGWAPKVACLKIVLFSLIYAAMLFAANEAIMGSPLDFKKLRSMMLAFAIFLIFGSMALLPFPGMASLSPEAVLNSKVEIVSLFTGITCHSQALGPMTCVIAIFLFADLLFTLQRADWLYITLLVCCPILIYKTSSRTAMGSFMAGITFIGFCFMQARGILPKWRRSATTVISLIILSAVVAAVSIPGIREGVVRFSMKVYGSNNKVVHFDAEGFVSTRESLVELSLYNYHRRPATGWGFQVNEEIGYMESRSQGIPITAPIEKGVWISAVLEEGGMIGLILYGGYFIIALCLLMKRKAYVGATLLLVFHISCLGEFSLFSMSSEGGLWYSLLFIGIVFDAQRLKNLESPPIWQ